VIFVCPGTAADIQRHTLAIADISFLNLLLYLPSSQLKARTSNMGCISSEYSTSVSASFYFYLAFEMWEAAG
jgi:hypothetical protein